MEMNKRITIIDQIRGFAMFGVLLVNLTMMENPLQMNQVVTTGAINIFFEKAIDFLAVGKFYTMFSILFGLGFFLFMEKSGEVLKVERLFKRRLRILLVFGLLHLVFGWSGDILHVYAIGGFFLLSKRKMSVKSLLKRGLALFLFSVILIAALTMLSMGSDPSTMPQIASYDETAFLSVVSNRVIHELPYILINLFVVLPRVISLFLFGYAIGKMEILNNVQKYLQQIKKTFYITSMLFLLLMVIRIVFPNVIMINLIAKELSTLVGALTYGTGLILISENKNLGKKLSILSAPGKMALTNYLIQTLFWTTVFYGYGGDIGGKVPYAMYLPMALLFYGVQIMICNIWLKYYKQGPMESLWRYFTYRASEKNQ